MSSDKLLTFDADGRAIVPAPTPKKFGPALPADLAADLPEDEFYR